MSVQSGPKPMRLWLSLLFFGLPGVVIYFSAYAVMPALAGLGWPMLYCYIASIAGTTFLLGLASIIACRREGARSWVGIKERLRLQPMKGRGWLWALGLFLFMLVGAVALKSTARILAAIPALAPPSHWPAIIDPRVPAPAGPVMTEFMGVALPGNWLAPAVFVAGLVINSFGEEFWWRGYVLPRQELAFGKWAWLIHGIMWTLFHYFTKWNLLVLLPGCLALSFAAQKLKNTWPGFVAHTLANGLEPTVIMVLGVLSQ